ncbi:MAG: hypothetical protein AAF870_02295 [Pseudomonadota bacterium]
MSILKKTTVAILGSAVVLTSAAGAFAHDRKGGDREGRGMQMFERADANGDEKLDLAEFSAPMTARFDEVDADSNGILTEAEMEAASEGKEGRRAKRIAKRLDGDDNGEVTKAELEERQQEMFSRLDSNEDGFITIDEAKKMKRGGGKRGGKRGGGDRT